MSRKLTLGPFVLISARARACLCRTDINYIVVKLNYHLRYVIRRAGIVFPLRGAHVGKGCRRTTIGRCVLVIASQDRCNSITKVYSERIPATKPRAYPARSFSQTGSTTVPVCYSPRTIVPFLRFTTLLHRKSSRTVENNRSCTGAISKFSIE